MIQTASAFAAKAPFRLLAGGDADFDILMIHGFGADSLSWMANAPALGSKYRVWGVDLPGHGEADSASNGSLASLTDAVMAGLAATVPGRVHLVGHSLGGSIALEIAKRVPAKIASLALFAPAGLGTGINRAFTDAFTQLRDAASAETILRKLVVRHRLINQHMISRVLAHLQKSQRRETLGLIAVHLRSIEGPVADAVAAVVRSAIPTMTIWGALDQINPPDRRRLNALGGEQHFLTEAGHLPQIEDYNTCNGLLQTFLEKHSQHTVAT